MRAIIASLVVVVLCGSALWWGTDGGRALTSEGARRLDIANSPRQLPDVVLTDQEGTELRLGDYRGAPVILEFIYTTCPDICLALGTAFEQLDGMLPDDIRLVSVSFDPSDDVERLAWFADRYGAKSPRWRVAGVMGNDMRTDLLTRAGVVVIPDGFGGFVHNAGLYVVTEDGKLSAVFDVEDIDGVRRKLAIP